jgi:23S rRNA (adenine-N6)-dimethyltransferase
VIAVEIDDKLASRLARSFRNEPNVSIVRGDILRTALPDGEWRAFGNIPFGATTHILRRLLSDPTTGLRRADLLVQLEAARKRASVERSTLASLTWQPWWKLTLERRVSRRGFEPPPTVDAGLLVARRRSRPLLDADERIAYVTFLRRAFERGGWPVRRSLRPDIPVKRWKALARERGIALDARPAELDVWDWVVVFKATQGERPDMRGTTLRR